jgi:hypothetical protein
MKTRLLLAVITLSVAALPALAQGPRRDGKWEVKAEIEMPNMPNMPAGMQMPAFTTTQCITPEEAKDPQKSMPQGGRGGRGAVPENCKVSDYKVDGNKVSWSMKCEPPQEMTGTGEFTYSGDTYTGVMTMNRGGQMMTMKYSGKRIGDCDKK